MKYKHIVFDVDGTLIDSEEAVLSSLRDVLKETTGRIFPMEELTFALGITGKDALLRLKIEDMETVLHRWEELLCFYEDTLSVYEGIAELVKTLAKKGYGLGVATSRTREEFDHDFGELDIRPYFDVTICADDTKEHKPTAEPLLKYMELSGALREEVLYVGDSIYDSECARNAGVDFALAVWGSHTETTRADYYLKKPADIFSYI